MAMDESLDLPPGFRFHPTDEEIITHYLSPKILNHEFIARAIAEVDLNKCEPWDLPSMANMGEKEWYFFCQRDRKYPTGTRTNRATESGYWKATGKDKEICKGGGVLVGMKKTLVFYRGRAPKGLKTNWVMHEYRLEGKAHLSNLSKSSKNEWVVCRVFHKNPGLKRSSTPMLGGDFVRMNSFTDELMNPHTLPPLMEPSYFNSVVAGEDSFDVKAIMTSSAPMSYYLSAMMDGNDDSLDRFNRPAPPTTTADSCNPHHMTSSCLPDFQTRNPYLSVAGGAEMGGFRTNYDAQTVMMRRHCKPDQFSNQSMLSQETGVSTDRNTEISSVISKHDIASCASYGDLDLPPADGGGVMDLANMWRC